MKRLLTAMKTDVVLQFRTKLYHIGIGVGVLVAAVLAWLGDPAQIFSYIPALMLLILVGLALLGLLLMLIRWWRRRHLNVKLRSRPARETADSDGDLDDGGALLIASLHLLEDAPGNRTDIVLDEDNVAIGRDIEVAQIVFGDSSVARLHARIRKRNGRYWLYDEGSASGTFLNHERLGLTPRQLQDGDEIRLGRLLLRFQLRPEVPELLDDEGEDGETAVED